MRVAVLGAAGIIGREIVRDLGDRGKSDLILADLKAPQLARLAEKLGAEAVPLDVTDGPATTRLLKGCDLALNATWYYYNPRVMEASLAAGCDYMDLGGLYHTTLEQLKMGPRFERAGRLALLGCGKAPGITNVMAAKGLPHFDRLRAVHLRSGRRALEPPTGLPLPYSPQTLLDELTLRPVVLEGGTLREVEPLGSPELVHHPEPCGDMEYITTLHSELATLPGYLGKGVEIMEFKVALASATVEALKRLIDLGFTSRDPVAGPWGSVVPRDVTVELLARLPPARGREVWITEVEMVGRGRDGPLGLILRVTGDGTLNGTALAAVATIDLLERGLVKASGVHAPEAVIPPGEFLGLLQSFGLGFSESLTSGGK